MAINVYSGVKSAPISDYGKGRVHAGESDVRLYPRDYVPDGTTRGLLYVHGAGQNSNAAITAAFYGQYYIVHRLAQVFPVLCADLGGTQTWGNSTVVSRLQEARTSLIEDMGALDGPVLCVGTSMGALSLLNYFANHSDEVIAGVGLIPVSDVDDIRDNDRLGLRDDIDLANGVTWPDPLPAGVNPTDNAAAFASFPYLAMYASDDEVIIPSTVTNLVSLMGDTAEAVNMGAVGGHSEDTLLALYDEPGYMQRVIHFLREAA